MVLTPSRLAIAAALGYAGVKVHARPRVALLATGDEVRELGEKLEGPLTFCNGRHLLAWLVRLHGGEAFSLGVAGDDPEEIVGLLRNVEADAVISTGGIGRGDRDFTLEAWKELDVETCFREINLSPGRNSALGLKESRTYWALPGNPWGAQLVFEELIRPALHRGLGLDECGDHTLPAALQAPLENPSGSYKAVRGKLSLVDGIARFYPQGRGAALLLQSMVENFAYTLLEPHVVDIPDGYMVRVRLHDFPPMAAPVLTHTTAHGV
jgi:molybdopterin molybdotransferase